MNRGNIFIELKRRNVYKAAVAYIVAGWALAQGIAQVFPVFDVPNWIVRVIVALIVVGFPITLIFAWAFEITPEGVKSTAEADAMPPIGATKQSHMDLHRCCRCRDLAGIVLPRSLHGRNQDNVVGR